ncbi:MAG: hypothetical protein RL734_1231 [Bacteroidota bacterium]|jgi:hypothetical protein
MNTYFLLFGKSQDFTFYAFDKNGLIPDFNVIIKHFDQLESLVFSVDEPDNKDIIAKYVFKTSKGKPYSLLKQYSCAQACAGDRLSGSTYGVAILSDGDVNISDYNLRLLKSAKETFAKLSLSGLKFTKSDFIDDAKKIWKGISEHNEGNEPSYFEKINVSPDIPILHRNDISAFYVHDLLEGAIEIGRMSTESNKVYITEDFEHLKRAYLKWGEVKFPVFHKVGNAYQQYTDEKTGSKRVGSSDLRDIQSELAIIKDDMQQTRRGLSKKMDDLSKEIMIWKIISITLAIILMVTVTYPFIFPKQYSINDKEMPRIKSYIDSKDSTTRIKYDSIRIKKLVLVDSNTLKRASETTTDSLNSYLSDSITVLIVKSQFY